MFTKILAGVPMRNVGDIFAGPRFDHHRAPIVGPPSYQLRLSRHPFGMLSTFAQGEHTGRQLVGWNTLFGPRGFPRGICPPQYRRALVGPRTDHLWHADIFFIRAILVSENQCGERTTPCTATVKHPTFHPGPRVDHHHCRTGGRPTPSFESPVRNGVDIFHRGGDNDSIYILTNRFYFANSSENEPVQNVDAISPGYWQHQQKIIQSRTVSDM
jgi:hypothetical protein